jgi:hypothetical protein
MEQYPSSDPDGYFVNEEISCLLRKNDAHYHIRKSIIGLCPEADETSPRSSTVKSALFLKFSEQHSVGFCVSSSAHRLYGKCSTHLIFLQLITLIIFYEKKSTINLINRARKADFTAV